MAKLLDDTLTYLSFPINKWEEDNDGNVIVTGTVTDGSVDRDRQIVDPAWSAKALGDWMDSGPNVRVMHSPSLYPAGRGLQVDLGNDNHQLKALVVEDTAKKLVKNQVLRAYSVGIANPVIKRDPTGRASGGIIVGGELAEVSLVDRPANKNCQLVLAKSADRDIPWTYGDLDALLAEAEADLVKGMKPDSGEEPDDDADTDFPDDDEFDDDDKEAEPDLTKSAYDIARDEWLAREPTLGGVSTSSPAFLGKRAEWQRWHAEGEAEGLDGTADGRARWAVKRDFDSGVGGGVDRDKLPDADFADPDVRKFPIVTPADVADAAGLAGHAADPDAVRDRIVQIAHRKGPAFVDQLPDSWGDVAKGSGAASLTDLFALDEPDVDKNFTTTTPDPDGLAPYNLQGQGGRKRKRDTTKAAKACPSCGADHHSDSKLRRCDECGAKLPKANKGRKDITVTKGLPAGVKPVGKHREPDGDGVELFEHDAGLPVDDDSVGKSTVSYRVKRMHDALCAAYPWDAVASDYPSLKSVADAIEPSFWADQVTSAAVKGDMLSVAALAMQAQDADDIAKGAIDVEKLADARDWLHKCFSDMYPDTKLTPSAPPSPGQFQRPYLSAGHAPLNASAGRVANIPPATHVPDPDDFRRPLITAGHEASSPSNKGDNLDTGGSVASGAARHYYRNASRDAARGAMQAMHDHISQTFPDMCPMAASKSVMPPDMGDTSRPRPVQPTAPPPAPGENVAKSFTPYDDERPDGLSPKAVRRLIKDARKAATADAIKAVSATYETTIHALQAQIDELGAQPDPAQAPLRGVAVRKAATPEPTPVVEKAHNPAVADEIEFTRHFLNHPNLAMREAAEARLRRLQTT